VRRDGETRPCKLQARLGARFCNSHGGRLPNIRREAAENVAKAKALQREGRNPLAARERRHPAVVIMDGVHTLDVLHQEAKRLLDKGEDITRDDVVRLTDAAERSVRGGKTAYEVRAIESLDIQARVDAEAMARVLGAVIDALRLDPDWNRDREAVARAAMRRELEAIDAERGRRVAIEAAP
jgi:hypothetical protein